ncbi:MAG: type II CAAX endopeptidase family protein [Anaerolineales bacterium]
MSDILETSIEEPVSSTIWDFVLYLTVGVGLFALASLGISRISQIGTPANTAAHYLINILIFSGVFYFLGIQRKRVTWSKIGFKPLVFTPWYFVLGFGLFILLLPLRGILAVLALKLTGSGYESLLYRSQIIMAGGFSWLNALMAVIAGGILIPFAEEVYFRGLWYTALRTRLSTVPAILISSLLFGLGHIDSAAVVAASTVIGIVNAIAYEKSQSLWLPIIIHAVNNTIGMVVLYTVMAIAPNLMPLPPS